MITLQWWNGMCWINCAGSFTREASAWISLGDDNYNYRTLDSDGNVLTDNSGEV